MGLLAGSDCPGDGRCDITIHCSLSRATAVSSSSSGSLRKFTAASGPDGATISEQPQILNALDGLRLQSGHATCTAQMGRPFGSRPSCAVLPGGGL